MPSSEELQCMLLSMTVPDVVCEVGKHYVPSELQHLCARSGGSYLAARVPAMFKATRGYEARITRGVLLYKYACEHVDTFLSSAELCIAARMNRSSSEYVTYAHSCLRNKLQERAAASMTDPLREMRLAVHLRRKRVHGHMLAAWAAEVARAPSASIFENEIAAIVDLWTSV